MSQTWVSVTRPCCLSKATGIVTGLEPSLDGVSVIRPKYCPSARVGALIVIHISVGLFLLRWILLSGFAPFLAGGLSETTMVAPAGD